MANISIFPQSSQYCGPQVCELCGFSWQTDSLTEKRTNFAGEKNIGENAENMEEGPGVCGHCFVLFGACIRIRAASAWWKDS